MESRGMESNGMEKHGEAWRSMEEHGRAWTSMEEHVLAAGLVWLSSCVLVLPQEIYDVPSVNLVWQSGCSDLAFEQKN